MEGFVTLQVTLQPMLLFTKNPACRLIQTGKRSSLYSRSCSRTRSGILIFKMPSNIIKADLVELVELDEFIGGWRLCHVVRLLNPGRVFR